MRSYRNLFFQDEIDFDAIKLPEFTQTEPDVPDLEVAERLTDAFSRAIEDGAYTGRGAWKRIRNERHGSFLHYLTRRNYRGVARSLASMFRNEMTYGLRSPQDPLYAQVQMLDTIVSLGVASGLVSARCPTDVNKEPLLHLDYREILERFTDFIGHDLAPPQCGAIAGLSFNGRIIPLGHLFQVYQAHRYRTMLRPGISFLEIGGGVGFMAHAALSLGTASEYCIVDLPQVNVFQGYLMLKSEFADQVELYRETVRGRKIRILPNTAMDTVGDKSLDVVLNVDSFPEMDGDTIGDYLEHIERVCRDRFISINRELNLANPPGRTFPWVHKMAMARPGLKLHSRTPDWIRQGYVEDIFSIQ